MRHVSVILVPGFGRPVLLCRGKMPRARGMAAYVRDGYGAFANPNLSVVVANAGFQGVWCETEPLCNPDLDDRIFDCLLASMAAVRAEDVRASFLFVDELNGLRQE